MLPLPLARKLVSPVIRQMATLLPFLATPLTGQYSAMVLASNYRVLLFQRRYFYFEYSGV